MKITHLFNSLPKRLFAGFLLFLAVMLPVATSAASTVKIEGSMGVANVTKGDTNYAHSVNATYNQVVKLQVYYHNTELPNSGKDAQNLRVKIDLPSTPGKVQTQTATISADNSNTVKDSTTVNLDSADEYLQYIPGSAVWRHNVGTNDNIKEVNTTVSDNIVTGGNGLVLENEKPCYNFSGTVTVMARVMLPGTKVVKQVEKANETGKWATSNTANPGDTLKYMITYQNTGNTTAKNVIVRDNLPPNMTYVPGSTVITNGDHPSGLKDTTNAVTTDGIIIGDYAPGAVAYVTLETKIDGADKLACGPTKFTNVGIAHPKGTPEYYNVANTTVNKTCQPKPPTPEYSCNLLTLSKSDNRTVKATVTYTAKNGATYKSTSFAWGDSKTTSGTATSASHSYAKDGTYNIVATVSFTVNGQTVTSTNNCKGSVTFKSQPQTPVYSCDLLSLSQDGRTVTASVAYTAQNGATFKTVTLNWGDNSTPLVTNNTTASYTYPGAAGNGPFNVTARVLFSVNGKDVYAPDNAACAKQVSFTTPTSCVPGQSPECTPPTLPNTGAGNVIGIFAGVVAISSIGYRLILGRKLARR